MLSRTQSTNPYSSTVQKRPSEEEDESEVNGCIDPLLPDNLPRPKKKLIKRQAAKTLSPDELALFQELDTASSGVYMCRIPSEADAQRNEAQYMNMFRKARELCTLPEEDATFPSTDAERIDTIRALFENISDWDNYQEMRQALDLKNRSIWDATVEGRASVSDARKQALLPTREVQQRRVLGRPMSDMTIELLSWRLMVRCFAKLLTSQAGHELTCRFFNAKQNAAIQSQQGITNVDCWSAADGA